MNHQHIARCLIDIGAVSFKVDPPFTWTSGRCAPIYCDNRLLMSHPKQRHHVAAAFKTLLSTQQWHPDVIAGTATAGIPHAAWLAQLMDLPMVYVRGSARHHGKQKRIEGALAPGQQVVLIEDLISTGGSAVDAACHLRDAGADLLGVAAIVTYGLKDASAGFAGVGIPLVTLTTFDTLLAESRQRGAISSAQAATIAQWQKDPAAWSLERGGTG
ncbi:MAG: orotate phosphoribosyltransferase [Myxococcota bacterium]|nr:orotate phosphoribosyltransferase [Myxococcota bacterium]